MQLMHVFFIHKLCFRSVLSNTNELRSMSVIDRNAEYFFDVGVHLFLSDYSCIHTCMKLTRIVKPV